MNNEVILSDVLLVKVHRSKESHKEGDGAPDNKTSVSLFR